MSKNGNELVSAIGALALDIHMNRPNELGCDIPASIDRSLLQAEAVDYQVEGDAIVFTSIEARNRVVAAYKFVERREVLPCDDPEWLNVAHELLCKEIGKGDSSAGRLLALVHEESDVFVTASVAIESKSVRTFDVLYSIGAALPYLKEISPNGILRLIAAQHEETRNDLAGGMLYGKLEHKLGGQNNTCNEIHSLLRSNATEATISLYPTIFLALAKSYPQEALKLLFEDAQSSNLLLKKVALWTLGRLLATSLVDGDSQSAVTEILIKEVSNPVEEVRQEAIRAAAEAVHVTDEFDSHLTSLCEAGNQYALIALANAIYMNVDKIKSKGVFAGWLQLLCKLSPDNGGVLQGLDFILSQLLSDESRQRLVIVWLTEWGCINAGDLPRDKSVAELFNSTVRELANRPALLAQLITDWLLADNRKLASAAAGMLSHLWVSGFRNPEFSSRRLDTLTQRDLLFLARRMLGFVFSEEHLLSLTLSLLNTKDAKQRVFGIAYGLLIDEIGKDYPSSTIEALERAKASTGEQELINFFSSAIAAIKERIDTLNALPRLTELRPHPRVQREFAKARHDQMQASMEEAQKDSIMRQLCTEIPLKAGVGSFSFREGAYSAPSYMQSISHAVSLPMREVSDAVGYDLHLFLMRIAKRGES